MNKTNLTMRETVDDAVSKYISLFRFVLFRLGLFCNVQKGCVAPR